MVSNDYFKKLSPEALCAVGLPAESLAFLSSYQHLKTTRDESLAWETICNEVR